MFEVGDRVFSTSRGWGVVDRISNGEVYPVVVKFDRDQLVTYTGDGKQFQSALRTLFFEEIPIPESALVRKHRHKKGDLVWYKPSDEVKEVRFFSRYGKSGIVYLFGDGRKSGGTFDVREDEIEPYDNQ